MEKEIKDIQRKLSLDKSRTKMLKKEIDLMALSGIDRKHIQVSDMFLNATEYIHYIEISKTKPITSPDKNNILLFIHGYGGFGAVYYKVLGELADHFHCIAIDLPGMGFSSRNPVIPFNSIDTCIDYFVSRILAFVDKMGLATFNIVGHSIGAFIAAHFFQKHHERVPKLILLSPAGMNMPFENQYEKFMQFHEEKNFLSKYMIRKVAHKIFEKKESPFGLMVWPLKGIFLNFYLKAKRFKFSERERELMHALMEYFMSLPECGERCLGYLLHYGMHSHRPVMDVLSGMKKRSDSIMVMWGQYDWMDKDDSIRKLNELEIDVRVTFAMNADHQLPFQSSEAIKTEVLATFGIGAPKEQTEYFEYE